MNPLIVIPARGGSKGVPRKNINLLNGKPLIQYTIDAAKQVFDDRLIFVSTDDKEIKQVVERMGLKIPALRPEYLANDHSGMYDVLLHAINVAERGGYFPDTLVLLQPTSPFRSSDHVRQALSLFDNTCDMVVSVKQTRSNPYYVLFEENNGFLTKSKNGSFARRQDCPVVWELNGAIYVIRVSVLKERRLENFSRVRKYEMDLISSHDIDDVLDWKVAEVIAVEFCQK